MCFGVQKHILGKKFRRLIREEILLHDTDLSGRQDILIVISAFQIIVAAAEIQEGAVDPPFGVKSQAKLYLEIVDMVIVQLYLEIQNDLLGGVGTVINGIEYLDGFDLFDRNAGEIGNEAV